MEWLNYHHLYYFCAVVRAGSISKASRELRVSSAAISTQLKNLEDSLGEKLLIRGNFSDDREEECTYETDSKKSPMRLDFTPKTEKMAVQGIYELKDDELKVCMRPANAPEGRPKEFATKAGTRLVLIVFKKKKT